MFVNVAYLASNHDNLFPMESPGEPHNHHNLFTLTYVYQ